MTQAIVVAAFILKDGKVLLSQRCDEKAVAPGRFHLPGGHVEVGEQPDYALRRELHEELSVSAKIGLPFATLAYTTADGMHTVAIVYSVAIKAGSIRLNNNENVAKAWVAAEDIASNLPSSDPIYHAIRRGLNRHLTAAD